MSKRIEENDDTYVNDWRAAEITGYARATLQSLRTRGGGPRYRKMPTGTVRYQVRDLNEWLDSGTVVSSTSEYPTKKAKT
jgi:hypothetical protein